MEKEDTEKDEQIQLEKENQRMDERTWKKKEGLIERTIQITKSVKEIDREIVNLMVVKEIMKNKLTI